MNFSQYTNKNADEVLELLKSDESGLSNKEVILRQKKNGLNEIKIRNVNALNILIRQFKSPFAFLLLIAGVVSVLTGQVADAVTILIFILINVVIGFFQEFHAERTMIMLRKFIPQKIKIIRDSKELLCDANLLVSGDIVCLEAGDIVPADLRIISTQNLLCDESVLTGESVPVSKISEPSHKSTEEIFSARNIAFSGSLIISGSARGAVVATAKNTVFGKIIKTVSGITRESSYEKSIVYFCKLILRIVTTTIAIIFIANIWMKGFTGFFELLLFSVALIVSILPEALPAVVTFALSRGSLKMAKQKVVVKRLSAIEDLGNIEVLCTDKTGTLTQNKMVLEKIVSSDRSKAFLYGILSCGADKIESKILNPFDAALYDQASEEVLEKSKKFNIISELPFDSYRMKSAFLAQNMRSKEKLLIVKGAPEFILKNCVKFGKNKEIKSAVSEEGKQGKRVLAIAYKEISKDKISISDERGLTFLGYFVFDDPLKSTAKEAIELSNKMGVKIKIITGDSREVAGFVAGKIGLVLSDEGIISGDELKEVTPEDFDFACEEKTVFARISPDIKHKIIKSLQKKYEVGFMGEGVNDAPALKTADVGIAVLEASAVARDAADVVLLQKDLRVVVDGIKDGRGIFANINKYIKTALANNFGQFYSMAVISLFINFLPMLPVQILLSNIISDLPLIFIATDAVDIDELRKPKMYELHNVLPLIVSLGLVGTLFDFIFFTIFYNSPNATIQTLWFIEGLLTDIVLIYIVRTHGKFWKAKRPGFWLSFSSILAGITIICLPFLAVGQKWFHFVAPPLIPLLIVFLITAMYFIASETVKLIFFRYWKLKNTI